MLTENGADREDKSHIKEDREGRSERRYNAKNKLYRDDKCQKR